jgi:hypothetical protein
MRRRSTGRASRFARRSLGVGVSAAMGFIAPVFVAPRAAQAVEIEDVAGETLTLDVTNTATLNYHFDNRDDNADLAPNPANLVNDTFGEFLDRLNLQGFYGAFRAGVRIDAATYFAQLDDFDLQRIAKERLPEGSGVERYNYENSFRRELNTRYVNSYYPSKLFVGYTASGLDVTLGDFYAQLGRGFVLSVRKIDELATDTTVRGLKASYKKSWSEGSLAVTALAGQMNPIRIDERSGRRLNGDGSPFFFGFPQASDFTYYQFDDRGNAGYTTLPARSGYLEDSMFGLSVEGGPRVVSLGLHGSAMLRKSYAEEFLRCDARDEENCRSRFPTFDTVNPSRLRDRVLSASASASVPDLFGHGDAYLEVAVQNNGAGRPIGLVDGDFLRAKDLTGYAVYFTASGREGPVTFNVEGKHYRSFLPLAANVNSNGAADPTFSSPEFDNVAYNQVPVAEPFYTQPIGAPNVCNTGGRGKVDWRVLKEASVYGWIGHYRSWSEVNPLNEECDTSDPKLATGTWDAASGVDLGFEGGKTYAKAWFGVRDTRHDEPIAGVNLAAPSDSFYREGYTRYDMAKHLTGDFSLQAQGWHRHRYEPTLSSRPWNEGENYLALRWAPHYAFIFGYEYLGRRGCQPDPDIDVCHYVSGGFQYRSASRDHAWEQLLDTVSIFVGQRRGAIRCVSGVCRQFPPFEGAKLELTSRF